MFFKFSKHILSCKVFYLILNTTFKLKEYTALILLNSALCIQIGSKINGLFMSLDITLIKKHSFL